MTPSAHKKGIRLAIATDNAVPLLYADAERLRQVLLNLVENALKFTPAGGTVSITSSRHDHGPERRTPREAWCCSARAGRPWSFASRDTGIGIPAAERERVFDAFYQVDSSSTREQGGTGLGLSIVKRLVDGHDGQVADRRQRPEGRRVRGHAPLEEGLTDRLVPSSSSMTARARKHRFTEGDAVELLARAFARKGASTLVGIGDDAAVVASPREPARPHHRRLRRGRVHFDRRWLSLEDVGYRASQAAVSDLAGMACARSRRSRTSAYRSTSASGARGGRAREQAQALDELGCPMVGGNMTRGPVLSIETAVIGSARRPSSGGATLGTSSGSWVTSGSRGPGSRSVSRGLTAGPPQRAYARWRHQQRCSTGGRSLWGARQPAVTSPTASPATPRTSPTRASSAWSSKKTP